MSFDLQGARQAGATDQQIVDFLASKMNFNAVDARNAGANDADMLNFLLPRANYAQANKENYDKLIGDMSPVEKFGVGMGRTFKGGWDSFAQTAANIGEGIGVVTPGTSEEIRKKAALEAASFKELTDRSGLATAGELAGGVATALPFMAIPGGQGMAARMAIGAGVGAAQGALQPVTQEGSFLENKLKQAGVGAAIGGAIPGASGILHAEPVKALVSSVYKKALATPAAAEGEMLSRELGGLLTPGQETGNKFLTMLENGARQSLFTADQVVSHDKKIMDAGRERVGRFISNLSRNDLSSEGLGVLLQDSVKNTIGDLAERRAVVAAKDYGAVRALAGDKPVIKFDNVINELDNIIGQSEGVAAGDWVKVGAQAKALKSKLLGKPEAMDQIGTLIDKPMQGSANVTINTAMKNRSAWSAASRSEGNVFSDISSNLDRQIASRLAKAAGKDFEQTADGVASPELSAALKYANENYQRFSQSINAVEKSALGRLVGNDVVDPILSGQGFNTIAGETATKRLMALTPSETRTALGIIGKTSPELIPDIKAFAVKDALEKATEGLHPNQIANGVSMSFNAFMKAMPDTAKLQSLGFNPSELREMGRIYGAMLRTGDKSGYNFSGTAVRQEAMGVANALGGLLSGSIKGALTIGGQAVGLKHIARAMTTTEGRQALLTLSKPTANLPQKERALALVAGQLQDTFHGSAQ